MSELKLAPSILSADFFNLGDEVATIEKLGADLIHFDVMDGHFVPNISYGSVIMKSLLGRTALPFDVHLMIEEPDLYINEFVSPQTEFITVHQEACRHLDRTVANIHSLGIKAGVSINPSTPPESLEYVLDSVDLVLVMAVNPGFGGQKFIESSIKKISKLSKWRDDYNFNYTIEVDGGIISENVSRVIDAGANIIVAGSSVFKGDTAKNTQCFQSILKDYNSAE